MAKKTRSFHLDYETYSDVDIKKVGAYNYARHPSTRVLMAAYAYGDDPVEHWDAVKNPAMPAKLKKALNSSNVLIHGFNVNFERQITVHVLKLDLPIERTRCTMVHAYLYSFSGGLDVVAKAVGLPEDKQKLDTGKDLIRRFCQEQPPSRKISHWGPHNDPEGWQKFIEYNKQDVETERAIHAYFKDYPVSEATWEEWFLDQRINDRGLPIDTALVHAAIKIRDAETHRILEIVKKETGVENPNSKPQMKAWFESQGYPLENMQAPTVEEAVKNCPKNKKKLRKVLEHIQQISKSSLGKWDAFARATCPDGNLYGSLQFAGASRTRRWAGRLVQPQNFPRPEEGLDTDLVADHMLKHGVDGLEERFGFPVLVLLASALRAAIHAPPGYQLNISDLAGIEGRVLPWLCFDEDKLQAIRNGVNMYLRAAARIYNVPYESLSKQSVEYMPGKVAELALGFQGAVGALNQMGSAYGVEFDEETALNIVKAWRRANQPIVDFWYETERAAIAAVNNPDLLFQSGRLAFEVVGGFLFMDLPSGRSIAYHKPQLLQGKLTYKGKHTYTGKWTRISTYGGKLVENATQATARDVLAYNMPLAEEKGFTLIGSVHDELLSLTRKAKKYDVSILNKILTRNPPWATDLPLGAAGYNGPRYKKD